MSPEQKEAKIMQRLIVAIIAIALLAGLFGCGGGENISGNLTKVGQNESELEDSVTNTGVATGETRLVSASVSDLAELESRSANENEIVSSRDKKTRAEGEIVSWRDELKGGSVSITFFKIDNPTSPLIRNKSGLNPDNAMWSVELPHGQYVVRALGYPAGQTKWAMIDFLPVTVLPADAALPIKLHLIKRETMQQQVEASVGYADESQLVHVQGSSVSDQFAAYDLNSLAEGLGGELLMGSGHSLLWKTDGAQDWQKDENFPGYDGGWNYNGRAYDIVILGDHVYVLQGKQNTIYRRTSLGGWEFAPHLYGVSTALCSDNGRLFVGQNNRVVVSEDDGNWKPLIEGVNVVSRTLYVNEGVIMFLDATTDQFMRSDDAGVSWQTVAKPGHAGWLPRVMYFDDTHIIVSYWFNEIYESQDGGAKWQTVPWPAIMGDITHMGFYFVTLTRGRLLGGMYDYSHQAYRILEWKGSRWHGVAYLNRLTRPYGAQIAPDGTLFVSAWQGDPDDLPYGGWHTMLTLR